MGIRVSPGDDLLLSVASSVALGVDARAEILGEDGVSYSLRVPLATSAGDRTTENFGGVVPSPVRGEIVSAYVGYSPSIGITPQRGQTPVNLQLVRGNRIFAELCKGYLSPLSGLSLGQYGETGPAGGHGSFELLTIADDVAGGTDTTLALLATNALRKVYGVALYYNASSDVADRIPNLDLLSQPWGALPTGFAATVPLAWTLAGPSTQADEEGFMFVYNPGRGDGYAIIQDNGGALTISSTATAPMPFPYIVHESDPVDLRVRITDGHANDRYSAYALIEEWVLG